MKRSLIVFSSVVATIFAADPVSASDEQLRAAIAQKRLTDFTSKNTIARDRNVHRQYGQRPHENVAPNFQPASKSSVLLPDPELLKRQAAPDCQFRSTPSASDDVTLHTIMRLDYEQQCYRQSESILRGRMERLQDAIGKTIESLKPFE